MRLNYSASGMFQTVTGQTKGETVMKGRKSNRKAGFTLLETAMVFAVGGVFFTSAWAGYINIQHTVVDLVTTNNAEIAATLANFRI